MEHLFIQVPSIVRCKIVKFMLEQVVELKVVKETIKVIKLKQTSAFKSIQL